MKPNRLVCVGLISVILIGFAGYYSINKSPYSGKENVEVPVSGSQNTISIGIISEDAANKINLFQPIADYVAAKLSNNETRYTGKIIVAKNMEDAANLLKEQKLDLLIESPFTAVLISKNSGSKPFLTRWKGGVGEYHSVFFVKKDSHIDTLNDIREKTIVFEDPGSTAGYFLPLVHLIQNGFNLSNSTFQNNTVYVFSGSAENSPLWIIEGRSEVGVLSNLDIEKIPVSIRERLKVIDRTVDVPRHVVSYRSELDPALTENIRQIFLKMDRDPEGIEIMNKAENTTKFDNLSEEEISNISKMVDLLK